MEDGTGDYNYQTTVELPGHFYEVVFCGYLDINGHSDYSRCFSDPNIIRNANAKLKVFKNLG